MGLLTESPVTAPVRGGVALRRWAVASLVANIAIVVTGGIVRLTASGMGCPTWPRCTEDSYVSHPALGIHGAIEFGNRLLTFVLIAIAILTFVTAWFHRENGRKRSDLRRVALIMVLGIPVQAIIGGISVWTHLNPFVVALHFVVSTGLIMLGTWLVRATRGWSVRPASPAAMAAVRVAFGGMVVAVLLGTLVTGSGPHAGDLDARRTGFDVEFMAHVHAAAVWVTIAATVLALYWVRSRAVVWLLVVEVLQAAIGITQYYTGLPVVLVALHLLGAGLAVVAATNLLLSVRPAGALTRTT